MANEESRTLDATIVETLPNARYRAQLGSGDQILAHVSGTMRMKCIRILPGDKVKVQLSPFDSTKGRITHAG